MRTTTSLQIHQKLNGTQPILEKDAKLPEDIQLIADKNPAAMHLLDQFGCDNRYLIAIGLEKFNDFITTINRTQLERNELLKQSVINVFRKRKFVYSLLKLGQIPAAQLLPLIFTHGTTIIPFISAVVDQKTAISNGTLPLCELAHAASVFDSCDLIPLINALGTLEAQQAIKENRLPLSPLFYLLIRNHLSLNDAINHIDNLVKNGPVLTEAASPLAYTSSLEEVEFEFKKVREIELLYQTCCDFYKKINELLLYHPIAFGRLMTAMTSDYALLAIKNQLMPVPVILHLATMIEPHHLASLIHIITLPTTQIALITKGVAINFILNQIIMKRWLPDIACAIITKLTEDCLNQSKINTMHSTNAILAYKNKVFPLLEIKQAATVIDPEALQPLIDALCLPLAQIAILENKIKLFDLFYLVITKQCSPEQAAHYIIHLTENSVENAPVYYCCLQPLPYDSGDTLLFPDKNNPCHDRLLELINDASLALKPNGTSLVAPLPL